ncbi:hypothetical protein [Kibdelosporangium philippinense]|uniref:hypothetical protein n=1 Tax=Kibdelosporangium philippinense TaxID=211113 RepID=UPI00360C3B43
MSTIPTQCVHRSITMKCAFRHTEMSIAAPAGHFSVPEWWTRCAGTVDTPFSNGGHGWVDRRVWAILTRIGLCASSSPGRPA